MADLLERIVSGALDPVYIVTSEQPLLIERVQAALLDQAVPPVARGFNYDVLDGKGITAARILTMCQTLPMMAKMRMVLVRDITTVAAGELAKLIPYLDSPNESTVLLLLATKVDKRIKFFVHARKKKFLHDLSVPRKLGPWIRAEASSRGIKLKSAAASRLSDVIGKDLARIALSLEQLSLYAGDRAISVEDVDDLIADTRERTVFELTDAIGQADVGKALAAVSSLCEQRQSAIGVVIMVARHMRNIGKFHAAMAERVPRRELARHVGVPPFAVDKLIAQTHIYRPHSVAKALSKLSDADRALKGQTSTAKILGKQLGERVILDRVVSDIIRLSR